LPRTYNAHTTGSDFDILKPLTEPPQLNPDSRVKKPVVQSVGKIEAI